jgi:hypothetical protein
LTISRQFFKKGTGERTRIILYFAKGCENAAFQRPRHCGDIGKPADSSFPIVPFVGKAFFRRQSEAGVQMTVSCPFGFLGLIHNTP